MSRVTMVVPMFDLLIMNGTGLASFCTMSFLPPAPNKQPDQIRDYYARRIRFWRGQVESARAPGARREALETLEDYEQLLRALGSGKGPD